MGALGVELVVTPLLCLWQMRVATKARDAAALPDPGAMSEVSGAVPDRLIGRYRRLLRHLAVGPFRGS